ncbi:MAG: hypothetical protein ACK5LT_12325 [Lachnospirales bacterium]
MKFKINFFIPSIALIVIILISVVFLLSNVKKNIPCHFTDVPWRNTMDKMLEIEGNNYSTYPSVYNGTTYSYKKDYMNLNGTIKYMYDDQNNIKSMAWSYSAPTLEDLENVYDSIETMVISKYGESHYSPDVSSNQGAVWYLDGYNIILSAMMTDTQKAIQFSYVLSEE